MILEKMVAAGNKMAIILEGKWCHILDYLLDAPKDSMILLVDDDDIFEVNRRAAYLSVPRQKLPAGTSPDIDLCIVLCYATAWVDANDPPVLMKNNETGDEE